MLGAQFGLGPDEWNFLAVLCGALVVALAPLYWTTLRNRKDTKTVKHEVSHNGGVQTDSPTVKDYAKAAYNEALAAKLAAADAKTVASRANETAVQAVERAEIAAARLNDHLEAADLERGVFLRRFDALDRHLTDSTADIVGKVEEGRSPA